MLVGVPRKLRPYVLITFICATTCSFGQQSTSNAPQKKAPKPELEVSPAPAPANPASPQVLQQLNSALESLVARVSPAVVQIQVSGFGALSESSRGETALIARQHAIGSGVIVDPDGYILTNAHVVAGAQRIRVVLPMPAQDSPQLTPLGKQHVLDAKLIGLHKPSDLALLKIEKTGLPTLALGPARRIHQGQLVLAIGSPEGLENSVTMGVVSSVARQPDPDKPLVYIQTDAPINPGNSGGPLVDADGYVLGINTMILSQGGGSEGLGFAIPARVAWFVYQSLRKYGHVHRVEIGAGAQEITPSLAEGLSLSQTYGVIVDDLVPGGPAETAGLKIGDIVITADGRSVDTMPALTAVMYLHPLDEVMKLVVLRGNEKKTLDVPVIEQRDPMDKFVDNVDPQKSLVQPLGILAVDLNDQIKSIVGDLRIPSGVLVVARAADLIGPETDLKTGDIIHSVNNAPVESVEALRAALKKIKPGGSVAMQIERDSGLQWLAFELE